MWMFCVHVLSCAYLSMYFLIWFYVSTLLCPVHMMNWSLALILLSFQRVHLYYRGWKSKNFILPTILQQEFWIHIRFQSLTWPSEIFRTQKWSRTCFLTVLVSAVVKKGCGNVGFGSAMSLHVTIDVMVCGGLWQPWWWQPLIPKIAVTLYILKLWRFGGGLLGPSS